MHVFKGIHIVKHVKDAKTMTISKWFLHHVCTFLSYLHSWFSEVAIAIIGILRLNHVQNKNKNKSKKQKQKQKTPQVNINSACSNTLAEMADSSSATQSLYHFAFLRGQTESTHVRLVFGLLKPRVITMKLFLHSTCLN